MLPKMEKILYATDLSAGARRALGYAATLTEQYDADLTVLHVLPDELELLSEEAGMNLAEVFGEQAAHWIDQGDQAKAAQAIHERLETMARDDFPDADGGSRLRGAKVRVVCGEAAERIVREAENSGADLVVMGTHGQTGLMNILLGSVARETIRHSKVPVLIVPLPD